MRKVPQIESKIFRIRGKNVMLDKDLAELYTVQTKVLIQAVKRNIYRFPEDFMFRMTKADYLRSQFVTSNKSNLRSQNATSKRGGRRYMPYAFTEEGVAMLSGVLNSKRAIMVNIQIMRVFVKLRRMGLTYIGLRRKIENMEKKYDGQFRIVFQAIRKLLEPPPQEKKRRIGFHAE